jgi:hypothetical protein
MVRAFSFFVLAFPVTGREVPLAPARSIVFRDPFMVVMLVV